MDFSLSDFQSMMRDSAARFIQDKYDFATRRRLVASELGYSEDNWALFAELGWLALPIAEAYGGLGGDLVDTIILQQELGKGLVVEPYFSTVLLSARLVQRLGNEAQKQELLSGVIAGELKLAFAYAESHFSYDIEQTETTATEVGDGFVINGHKAVVLGAKTADRLLVTTRTSNQQGDVDGITVFLVDPQQPGVSLRCYATNNGQQAAEVILDQVEVADDAMIGKPGAAQAAITTVLDEAIVALCAEAVGAMEKLVNTTTEYVKSREQFGQKIGKFQVLQHRLVDMFIEYEQSKSMLYFAAMQLAQEGSESQRAASMLKTKIGNSIRFIGQQAIQLHGGMGMADELDVGHYFKHMTVINSLLGSHDYHLQRLVDGFGC